MTAKPKRKRSLSPRTSEVLREHNGPLPIWIRPPMVGVEHFSGLSRAKLYQLAAEGKIRSISLREEGQIKGCRLFHLQSIFDYFGRIECQAKKEAVA